jgi:uncharacterized protein
MRFLTQIISLVAPKATEVFVGPLAESVELLVLQPTPFCNINCDYCYLPNRNDNRRMSLDTIRAAILMVLDGGLVDRRLSIVWHAGEPLVLPLSYYEESFDLIENTVQGRCKVSYSFQSNGTLIDDNWCRFLIKHSARIGLSIDGPAFIHDVHRRSRDGRPTHAQTMLGARKLKEYGIPFHVIAVLSADSLDHAVPIYRFFEELGVREVGFNVEEQEGAHSASSLRGEVAECRIEEFWHQLYELSASSESKLQIREFQRATRAILTSNSTSPWHEIALYNDQVVPFRILSVDFAGNVSTFSPELLGSCDSDFSDFIFGKVGSNGIAEMRSSEVFQKTANEVMRGVKACASTCEYFSVCGGGAPANKYSENRSLSSTTTMYCRTSIQMPLRAVLAGLERKLKLSAPKSSPMESHLNSGPQTLS